MKTSRRDFLKSTATAGAGAIAGSMIQGCRPKEEDRSSLPDQDDEWVRWWDARVAAIESVLGKSTGIVGHSTVPFDFGAEVGGGADIIYFRNHVDGKENPRGRFLKITEEVGGRRDTIIIPSTGLDLFRSTIEKAIEADKQNGSVKAE